MVGKKVTGIKEKKNFIQDDIAAPFSRQNKSYRGERIKRSEKVLPIVLLF